MCLNDVVMRTVFRQIRQVTICRNTKILFLFNQHFKCYQEIYRLCKIYIVNALLFIRHILFRFLHTPTQEREAHSSRDLSTGKFWLVALFWALAMAISDGCQYSVHRCDGSDALPKPTLFKQKRNFVGNRFCKIL